MEAKLKHLEFAQGAINRMAANSFSLKTWTVTLVAAIMALGTKDGLPGVVPIALVPVAVFWFLDAYFLRMERMYRKLYEEVCQTEPAKIGFGLNPSAFAKSVPGYVATMWSVTLRWFYLGLTLAVVIVFGVAWRIHPT